MEVWKPLKSSKGYYEVSNLGRVRNVKTGRIRKLCKNQSGVNIVKLAGYQNRTYSVARLVAEAFVADKIKQVRHKGDVGDDSLENLNVEVDYD